MISPVFEALSDQHPELKFMQVTIGLYFLRAADIWQDVPLAPMANCLAGILFLAAASNLQEQQSKSWCAFYGGMTLLYTQGFGHVGPFNSGQTYLACSPCPAGPY